MRKAVTTALEKAGRDGSREATAEHLLLAIADDSICAATFLFEQSGISPVTIIDRIESGATSNAPPLAERATQLSAGAMHVLDVASGEADRLGDRHVGTEHIALSLALTNGSHAAATLKTLGFTHARGEAALKQWHRRGMPRQRRGQPQRLSFIHRLVPHIVIKGLSVPSILWRIFVRKSLGHPAFVKNPYPMYEKLRKTEPVRKDPFAPVWVITTYADTMTMLRDARFKKDPFAFERLPAAAREQLGVSEASAGRSSSEMVSMLFLDPPEHTRVRSIFTKAFTPRRLESLRPRIQLIADKLLDRAEQRAGASKTIDLVRDLAAPLPVTVIAELLGFPPEDFEKIKHWSDELTESLALNATPKVQQRAYQAREELREYFEGVVAQVKRNRGENLLSALIHGEASGQRGEENNTTCSPKPTAQPWAFNTEQENTEQIDSNRFNPDELFSNSILLLAAGHETTTGLISLGMLSLLNHPEQLRDLREHTDELIASAVEEMLRYDTPVQWSSRVTGEDLILSGQKIERGQILLASIGAANRDPSVFADPNKFDIRRKDNRHLSFGAGCHYCLGAALAKMEAEIAVATLVKRYPKLQLAERKVKWRKGLTFRGPVKLLLKLG